MSGEAVERIRSGAEHILRGVKKILEGRENDQSLQKHKDTYATECLILGLITLGDTGMRMPDEQFRTCATKVHEAIVKAAGKDAEVIYGFQQSHHQTIEEYLTRMRIPNNLAKRILDAARNEL